MSLASPLSPDHANTNRHCLLIRIECLLANFPLNFSKWLLGGERKSRSQVASSINCSFRKSLSLISEESGLHEFITEAVIALITLHIVAAVYHPQYCNTNIILWHAPIEFQGMIHQRVCDIGRGRIFAFQFYLHASGYVH
jgi:hypothetical protein